jgi:hypothetical protein
MKCIECNRICGDCDLLDFLKGLKKSDCCLYSVEGLWTIEHMNVEKQLFAAIASGETLREVFDKAIAKDWKPVEGEDVFRGVEEDIIAENLRLKEELESAQSQFKMLLGIRYQPGDPVVNYANSILLENKKLKEHLEEIINRMSQKEMSEPVNDSEDTQIKVLQRQLIDCQRELIAEKDSHSLCRTELMDLRVSIRDKELEKKRSKAFRCG